MGAEQGATRRRQLTAAAAVAAALALVAVVAAPARVTLPAPSDGDPRLELVNAALGLNLGKARDTKGRRPVALKKFFKKVSPKALGATRAAFAEGLERVDAAVAKQPAAARAAGDCSPPPGAPSQQYTGQGVDAHVDLANQQAQIGVEVAGRGIRIVADLNLCDKRDKFKAPDCPTAQGVVEASDSSQDYVGVRVYQDGKLIYSTSLRSKTETMIKGQVADDAKLDHLEILHSYSTTSSVGGSQQQYGPVSVRLAFSGRTRVNMRTEQYDPSNTAVDVRVQMRGVDAGELRAAEADQKPKLRKEAEENFVAAIKKAIERLREKERGWQEVNKCASVEFDPPKDTVTVSQGQSGQVQARIDSKQGGSPPKATWTVSDQANASFSPTTAETNAAPFGYTASTTGTPANIQAKFKAVSRAGIAEGTWTARSEPPPPPGFAGPINGTAVYDSQELGAGNSLDADWFGNLVVTFSPPQSPGEPPTYKITGGSVNYNYTGRVGGCDVVGAEAFGLATQPDLNDSPVLTFFDTTPRSYQLLVPMPVLEQVNGTKSDCDDPNDNGDEFQWFVAAGLPWLVYGPQPGGPVADDWTITNTGSGNNGSGTPDQTWFWSLMPTP
jgi:hypothetical protein